MRTIWQFGDKYLYIDNGEPASEADLAVWKAKHARLKAEREIDQAVAEAILKVWHDKYDPAMKEFFSFEGEEDDDDYWCCANEAHLIYRLSTAIFDNSFDSAEGKVPADMKRLFPKYWKKALAGYYRGEHDT